MSPFDLVVAWLSVLLVIVGTFLAGLRVLRWYREVHGLRDEK